MNKLAIISTVALGINDENMKELLSFIHDYREHVSVWGFVPLTPCWEGSKVDLEPTTTECVENIFEKMVPEIEFVSTGMMKFNVLSRFFGRQTLGGSHPNCESATLLVSNGDRYLPISSYLTIQLSDLLARLRKLDSHLVLKSAALPATGWQRRVFDARTLLRMMGVSKACSGPEEDIRKSDVAQRGKGCGGSDTGKENRSHPERPDPLQAHAHTHNNSV